MIILKTIGLMVVLVFLGIPGISNAEEHPMATIGKKAGDTFHPKYDTPEEYRAQSIEKPFLGGTNLARKLYRLTRERKEAFKGYIWKSGEFESWTEEQKREVIRNPKEYFGVNYLIEIDDVHVVYDEKGILLGYVFEAQDYVKAEIIQDGAWFIFYTDDKLKVVYSEEGTA